MSFFQIPLPPILQVQIYIKIIDNKIGALQK